MPVITTYMKIGKFLESCKLPKLMKEKINHVDISVSIKEMYIIKMPSHKEIQT